MPGILYITYLDAQICIFLGCRLDIAQTGHLVVVGLDDIIDRLAAYEDTGLEPEEISKIREDVEDGVLKSTARRYGISVDRLRELAQADREGRIEIIEPDVMECIKTVRKAQAMLRMEYK